MKTEKPVPPRQLVSGVPPALEAICLRALAKNPEERYPSAGELAQEVQRWLADEPVTVYPERWPTRLGRWARQHRPVVAAASALLMTAVVALSISTVLIRQSEKAEQAARQRADRNLRLARDAVDKTVTYITGDPRLREADFLPLRRQLLEYMAPFYEEFVKQRKDDPELEAARGRAFLSLAYLRSETGQIELALSAYEHMRSVFTQLSKDFPWEREYRYQLAAAHSGLGNVFQQLGRRSEAEAAFGEALKIREQVPIRGPDGLQNLAQTNANLATLLAEAGKHVQAVNACRNALRIQERLAADYPNNAQYRADLAHSYSNLAIMVNAQGQHDTAVAACQDALKIQKKLAADFPKERIYRQKLARGYNVLATLLRGIGQRAEAAAALRDALKIKSQLSAEFSSVPGYRRELAEGHYNLGVLLLELAERKQAEAEVREALNIEARLAAEFPKERDYRRDQAVFSSGLAALLDETGQPQKAEESYRQALGLMEQLAIEFPHIPAYRMYRAGIRRNLSGLLLKSGRIDDADTVFHDAVPILKQLVAEFPNMPDYAHELGVALDVKAGLLDARDNFSQARECLEEAARHHQSALKANPQNQIYRQRFLRNRLLLIGTLAALGDHPGAQKAAYLLPTIREDAPTDIPQAARVLAKCISFAKEDTKLPPDKREEFARSYAAWAVALLRLGYRTGYDVPARIKSDAALDSLRSRPEFVELMKELEPNAKEDGK